MSGLENDPDHAHKTCGGKHDEIGGATVEKGDLTEKGLRASDRVCKSRVNWRAGMWVTNICRNWGLIMRFRKIGRIEGVSGNS